MNYNERLENLKELLDQHYEWPNSYMFKFIVPGNKQSEVQQILQSAESYSRPSSSGKYLSMTFELECSSSDDVIEIYRKVSTVKGIVTL